MLRVRKLHAVTTEQWETEFKPGNVSLSSNLEADVELLSNEFKRVLDALAPIKNCSISLKPKKPWFYKELVVAKAKVRCHEKKWLRNKLPSTWTAYKESEILTMPNLTIAKKPTYANKSQTVLMTLKSYIHW